MKRVEHRAWMMSLGALAWLSACTDANESLIVVQAQVPDDECVVSDEGDSTVRLESGTLDVALDQLYSYKLFPLVQNNLVELSDDTNIDANRVAISGARVKIVPPTGVSVPFRADCAAEFDHPSQGAVFPGSQRAVRVEAIRSCHADLLRNLFRTGALNPALSESVFFRVIVRIKGRHGGTEILSDPFEFPIRICYGCLQTGFTGPHSLFNFPKTPPCSALATNPFRGNQCAPAQDFGPILCCARDELGEVLQCPGVPTGADAEEP
jgi:hypothetical protein